MQDKEHSNLVIIAGIAGVFGINIIMGMASDFESKLLLTQLQQAEITVQKFVEFMSPYLDQSGINILRTKLLLPIRAEEENPAALVTPDSADRLNAFINNLEKIDKIAALVAKESYDAFILTQPNVLKSINPE